MSRKRLVSLMTGLMLLVVLQIILASVLLLTNVSWWAPRFADWLQSPSYKPHSDAIIVLGGNTIQRTKTGIMLFQQGLAARLVITGDAPAVNNVDPSDSKQAQALAIAQGIPQTAITLLSTSTTFEDAQQITQFVRTRNLSQVIIVTDWFHSRRAICSVKVALGDQASSVFFWPTDTPFSPANWWQSPIGRTTVLTEFLKEIYYALVYHTPLSNCWPGDINLPFLIGLWGFSGVASLIIVFAIQKWASDHLLDMPNERSSHQIPTPRGGGLGIVVMTLIPFAIYSILSGMASLLTSLAFVGTSATIAFVGWRDDRQSLPARLRLAIQVMLAAALLLLSGNTMSRFSVPFLGVVALGTGISFFVNIVWIVGLTNAYNFMDGIDGLAGVQAVTAGSAWCLLLAGEGQTNLLLLAGLIVATSVGFLVWNAPPARIFLGDVGSTFLGFALAALPLLAYSQTQNPHLFITGVLFVAPFVFDSGLTMLRRGLKRENVFKPHRSHLYQRLIKIGYSHRQVTGLYLVLCAISALCGLLYYSGNDQVAAAAWIGVIMLCVMLTVAVTALEAKHHRQSNAIIPQADLSGS